MPADQALVLACYVSMVALVVWHVYVSMVAPAGLSASMIAVHRAESDGREV